MAQSFTERVLAPYRVTITADNVADTVIKSYSDDTKQKQQRPSKTIFKLSLDERSEVAHVLADLRVVTKAGVAAIVKICLT